MGSGVCSAQSHNQNINQSLQSFLSNIKYYDSEVDPISHRSIDVYSYKQIFLHKKVYQIQAREQLELFANFILVCARCPTGVQQIAQVSSTKSCSPKCSNNYSVCVFAEHLNFSLAQHLQNLRFKNQYLRSKQILYIMKELVTGAEYLAKKNLFVKSFDSTAIYLSSTYEIRIPYCNVVGNEWQDGILGNSSLNQVLCMAPQQIDPAYSTPQIRQFTKRTPEISRVFSLGMLVLQCATMLDGVITYYNYSGRKIDLLKLNADIKGLKDGTLAALLSRLLQADPRKRIKLKELSYIINKFDQSMFEKYLAIY